MSDLRPDPELADLAARATPPMSLDPDALLHAAHRYVRRRTAARVAGGALALVGVVAVAGQIADRTGAPQPAQPPTRIELPVTDGRLVEIADGFLAVGWTAQAHAPDPHAVPLGDAVHQVDLGLLSGDHELVLAVGPEEDGRQDGAASYTLVGARDADGYGGGAWTWGDVPEGRRFSGRLDTGEWSELVVAPDGLADPRVLLWSTTGIRTDDGVVTSLELPTFTAPDGQVLAAALGDSGVTARMVAGRSGIVFVGADGTVVQAPCDDAADCAAIEDVRGLSAAVTALRAEPRAATASVDEPAPGLRATTALARATAQGWGTGLTLLGGDGGTTDVLLTRAADGLLASVGDDARPLTWGDGSAPPAPQRWSQDDELRLVAGAVPDGRRAVLWFPGGAPNGFQAVDVPTVEDPRGSGHRLFVAALDWLDVSSSDVTVLYVAQDATGTLRSAGCTDLPGACLAAQPDGGADLLDELTARDLVVVDTAPRD